MINASKEFKQKLKDGANIVNYADVTLADGTILDLTYEDFMIGGCSIEDKTTDGKFGVGFCIGKTLTLRIANHDERFSRYDFYGSIINLYVALLLDNGTVERIKKGVYYTIVPETPGDIIEISAVDGMFKFDRDYSDSKTTYPATLQRIISDACLDCGIPIGFRQFDNMGFLVKEKPESATYRQVISWACQIAGYNARIDSDGYMQLIWYNTNLLDMRRYDGGDFKVWSHDTILDGGDFTYSPHTIVIDGGNFLDPTPESVYEFKSLNVSTDDIVLTGVQVIWGENESIAGESGYVIKIEQNPFVNGKEQQIAAYLGSRMIGLAFRAFSGEVLGNPLYEPFDIARIYDKKNNMYLTIINSVLYTIGSYTKIACEAEDPLSNGSSYYSASAAAVVEARRNTKKQITEYDKAVQNMNQIAMNAMGFHTTYEDQIDGSRIIYLHDNPNLADSKTIYKQTIDGFFISQDGGKSYTAGFDKNGNVVVNILYAIGIVADWIRTGQLIVKDEKGVTTFLADVDTGRVIINAESVSIGGDSIQDISDSAAEKAVDAQTQIDIFNKLTNDGQAEGIYLHNKVLYINASYVKTGELSADRIGAGTIEGNIIAKNLMMTGGEINIESTEDKNVIKLSRFDSDGNMYSAAVKPGFLNVSYRPKAGVDADDDMFDSYVSMDSSGLYSKKSRGEEIHINHDDFEKLHFMPRFLFGSKVLESDGTSTSIKVLSLDDLRFDFQSSNVSGNNTMVSFANGDGNAQSVHVDGATFLTDAWYVTFNGVPAKGPIRINYMVSYFGQETR